MVSYGTVIEIDAAAMTSAAVSTPLVEGDVIEEKWVGAIKPTAGVRGG